MRKWVDILPALLGAALVLSACATTGSADDRARSDPNRLTAEELASVEVATLYEAVQRLRPRWLQVRSQRSLEGGDTGILVYQGQTRLGGPEALRQLDPGAAAWLEYLDGSTASASLPGIRGHVQGAIVIHTARAGT